MRVGKIKRMMIFYPILYYHWAKCHDNEDCESVKCRIIILQKKSSHWNFLLLTRMDKVTCPLAEIIGFSLTGFCHNFREITVFINVQLSKSFRNS